MFSTAWFAAACVIVAASVTSAIDMSDTSDIPLMQAVDRGEFHNMHFGDAATAHARSTNGSNLGVPMQLHLLSNTNATGAVCKRDSALPATKLAVVDNTMEPPLPCAAASVSCCIATQQTSRI